MVITFNCLTFVYMFSSPDFQGCYFYKSSTLEMTVRGQANNCCLSNAKLNPLQNEASLPNQVMSDSFSFASMTIL